MSYLRLAGQLLVGPPGADPKQARATAVELTGIEPAAAGRRRRRNQCDVQCGVKNCKGGHTAARPPASGGPRETKQLARSGSRYPGKWLWGVESNPQPARVLRTRNPRQYGILSLSEAVGSARCGKSVAKGPEICESSFASRPSFLSVVLTWPLQPRAEPISSVSTFGSGNGGRTSKFLWALAGRQALVASLRLIVRSLRASARPSDREAIEAGGRWGSLAARRRQRCA